MQSCTGQPLGSSVLGKHLVQTEEGEVAKEKALILMQAETPANAAAPNGKNLLYQER